MPRRERKAAPKSLGKKMPQRLPHGPRDVPPQNHQQKAGIGKGPPPVPYSLRVLPKKGGGGRPCAYQSAARRVILFRERRI